MSDEKRDAWFADQYRHPHESKHTIGEVLSWFREAGFDFVNGVPKPRARDAFSAEERLFETAAAGGAVDHALAQAKLVMTGNQEGGFYIMIGRKRATGVN